MPLFSRRHKSPSIYSMYVSSDGSVPEGYTRLIDSPEVAACINHYAAVISSATIYLMRHTDEGDKRVINALSRFIDIDPCPGIGTRQTLMAWIVAKLLGDGDGNAFVLPHFSGDSLSCLEPMPGATAIGNADGRSYVVQWKGRKYYPDEVMHFILFPDPDSPWKGRGLRLQAEKLAASLKQTGKLKDSLSSPDYKPPLIISVDSDSDLSQKAKRDSFRDMYLDETGSGKPWILPAGLMKVDQIRPLSLTDLAVKDTVELDKKTIGSIYGMPLFLMGLGKFDADEYNTHVKIHIIPIVTGIEQQMTLKLLTSDQMYVRLNRRHLYNYDLNTLVRLELSMSDRGFVNGDEVRAAALMDPAGLKDFRSLENYIPFDMADQQSKLTPQKEENNGE